MYEEPTEYSIAPVAGVSPTSTPPKHYHYTFRLDCFLELFNNMSIGGIPYVQITKLKSAVSFPLVTFKRMLEIEEHHFANLGNQYRDLRVSFPGHYAYTTTPRNQLQKQWDQFIIVLSFGAMNNRVCLERGEFFRFKEVLPRLVKLADELAEGGKAELVRSGLYETPPCRDCDNPEEPILVTD